MYYNREDIPPHPQQTEDRPSDAAGTASNSDIGHKSDTMLVNILRNNHQAAVSSLKRVYLIPCHDKLIKDYSTGDFGM